jgi:tungstate transport system ATP-binding protein
MTVISDVMNLKVLRKSFNGLPLLDIRDFVIAAKTAYVLTGKNGVGKSVFLRILAGLEKADEISCECFGEMQRQWPNVDAIRNQIVYVHQHPVMLHTSVEKNISYGLRMQRLPKDEVSARTEQVLSWAGLSHLRARFSHGLSGGEKQKIALARAQILRPKLLLLDEPSANLDGEAREQVIALIPDLLQQGMSVVMACHDSDLIHMPKVRHLKLRDTHIENRSAD